MKSLEFSPDGSILASGSVDRTVRTWDIATGTEVDRFEGHAGSLVALEFDPDGETLYTSADDSRVLAWDLDGRRRFLAQEVAGEPRSSLGSVAVPSPDGRSVVYVGSTASTGSSVRFLDVEAGTVGPALDDPDGAALAAWLTPESGRVVTAAGNSLRIWDSRTAAMVDEGAVVQSDITALAATSDGSSVLVGDESGAVLRVDPQTLSAAGPAVTLGFAVKAIAPVPGGSSAVALLDDGTYAIVDLTDGTVDANGPLGLEPRAAAVSPDGSRLAVGGSRGEVRLWDLDSGELLATPSERHSQWVQAVSFSADGATAVTASFDGGVRAWDGRTGAALGGVGPGAVASPAMATLPPDGHTAVIATRDGAVYRWNTEPDSWIAYACQLAGRNLTEAEWQETMGDQTYRETCPAG